MRLSKVSAIRSGVAAFSLALCTMLGSHAHAAKIFTISGTITPDQNGNVYYSDILPFPSVDYKSYTQGLNVRFSSPVFATVTIWPSGYYDYFDPDGEMIPGNDLVERPIDFNGTSTGADRYSAPILHFQGGSTRRESFIDAFFTIDAYEMSAPVSFTMNGFAGVPEPSTWALMILGLGGIGVAMRKRSWRKSENGRLSLAS